jgi:hypothetical protein
VSRWILWLALAGAALSSTAAAGAAPRAGAAVLEIENPARARTTRIALSDATFEVTSHHSMYDAPVTEEFEVVGDRIILRAVSSPSAAVREYFGLTGPGERHAVVREHREVAFRIAAGRPQQLRAGGGVRSFLEFGEHGERLVLRGSSR